MIHISYLIQLSNKQLNTKLLQITVITRFVCYSYRNCGKIFLQNKACIYLNDDSTDLSLHSLPCFRNVDNDHRKLQQLKQLFKQVFVNLNAICCITLERVSVVKALKAFIVLEGEFYFLDII